MTRGRTLAAADKRGLPGPEADPSLRRAGRDLGHPAVLGASLLSCLAEDPIHAVALIVKTYAHTAQVAGVRHAHQPGTGGCRQTPMDPAGTVVHRLRQ